MDRYEGPITVEATGAPQKDGLYDVPISLNAKWEFKNPDWTLVWAQPGTPSAELQARYGAVYWGDKGRLTVTYGDGANTATDEKVKDFAAQCDALGRCHERPHLPRR